MPKRKRPELKPEEQFERFKETARMVEADETGKTFEKAFKQITKKPAPHTLGENQANRDALAIMRANRARRRKSVSDQ